MILFHPPWARPAHLAMCRLPLPAMLPIPPALTAMMALSLALPAMGPPLAMAMALSLPATGPPLATAMAHYHQTMAPPTQIVTTACRHQTTAPLQATALTLTTMAPLAQMITTAHEHHTMAPLQAMALGLDSTLEDPEELL